jgi:GNAT superfamily N-acetyltransferase
VGDVMTCDLLVRRATERELRFILALSKEESAAIGFIGNRYEKPKPSDYCLVALRNNDPVGFAYGSTPSYRNARCWQIAVRKDARFLEHGAALVQEIERLAERAGCPTITARCAVELPSNAFWQAESFQHVALARGQIGDGYAKSGRQVKVWVKDLHPLLIPRDGEVHIAERRHRAGGGP